MSSSLLVLGSCGAWPEPWRACSGFVLDLAGYRIALDLGYGTLPRLLAHLDCLRTPLEARRRARNRILSQVSRFGTRATKRLRYLHDTAVTDEV
jgi:hypothetical protein